MSLEISNLELILNIVNIIRLEEGYQPNFRWNRTKRNLTELD
jgi:hypothetical protein